MNVPVLLEDNHCLVVDKPAGMLSQGDSTGDLSLVDWASDYLRARFHKPGNVYVGLVHRLDRPTSGVVLLARTSKAASRLSEQFRTGRIAKSYLAVCDGQAGEQAGIWEDWLTKDEIHNKVTATPAEVSGSQLARVGFEVVFARNQKVGLLLKPMTGRGHQLRVQLASRGLPIVGDAKYGSRTPLLANDGRPRIALHAARLVFKHPTRGEICEVQAPLPSDWPAEGSAFGASWNRSSKPTELPDR